MLGIVLELGDVASTVRRLQQVRLRASPKWAQVSDCGDASIHKHPFFLTCRNEQRESHKPQRIGKQEGNDGLGPEFGGAKF